MNTAQVGGIESQMDWSKTALTLPTNTLGMVDHTET